MQDAPRDLAAGLKDEDLEVERQGIAFSIGDSLCRFPRRADNEMAEATETPTGFLLDIFFAQVWHVSYRRHQND